ncbi:hypothetical protein [Paraburkholderia sp. J63]|uniref:hypothetical protein n=1 Tax=Paraburkholderia sp. J63 TaxID=2805434 RepID=UPI002ABE52A7|nr:hypothetical protein [Paraburkholderia sp. J63]
MLAIVVSAWISLALSNRARRETLKDIRDAARRKELETADALTTLAEKSLALQKSIAAKLQNREAVAEAASDQLPFDMAMLDGLERALFRVPLHEMPGELLTLTLILRETVRQCRMKIEMAFQFHREMDARQYQDLFDTLANMNESLTETVKDFRTKREALTRPF